MARKGSYWAEWGDIYRTFTCERGIIHCCHISDATVNTRRMQKLQKKKIARDSPCWLSNYVFMSAVGQVCNCSSSWWHCMVTCTHDYYSRTDTWPSSSLLVVVSWRLPFRMHSTAFSHRERVEHYTMQNVSTHDLVLFPLGGANTTKNEQHTAHDHNP